MEKQRHVKLLSIIALVVAIAGMSLGFAAFSTTLNISSNASVSPSSSNFKLGFYPSEIPTLDAAVIVPSTSGGATGNNVTLSPASTAISGLKANFTEPGQTIEYSFYVGNEGEYDAYLRAINFLNVSGQNKNQVCTPGTGTTEHLAHTACIAITISVEVNNLVATTTNTSISGNILSPGEFIPITVKIIYAKDAVRADGPFSVEFGGIALDYSTVDGTSNTITFTIDGKTYQAEEGMIWGEWIKSSYNTDSFTASNGTGDFYDKVLSPDGSLEVVNSYSTVYADQLIISGNDYKTGFGSVGRKDF